MAAPADAERALAVAQILEPSTHAPYSFSFANFLLREHKFGLYSDRSICKAFMQGHCPQGEDCPDKHHIPSNYQSLICKHWLRGLCKKGDNCEFLHEFNLREMPECVNFRNYGICQNGPDCLYLHIDPALKQSPCEWFENGFCPLGPHCGAKHIKKKPVCKFYMAGFCPDGRECQEGPHPVWREKEAMKKPQLKVVLSEEEQEREVERKLAQMERDAAEQESQPRYVDKGTYNQQKMSGRGRGRRGGWNKRRDRH